ncbi:nucleotidyltransferase domain-containing protein [Gracilimonas mengyeensis]|uniref:Nucleotidyltransferase domain-containing protein n=1 Tax=Gracilimonas mengyeensis TaxID=1302730 RepID=A0A521FKP9_9BACT|nr:nucleotidyltransferase domain-containing protein [Gracilimonas mengyeensis]SMO96777.1 Nucleotidyltransferase domain-containing protein [Gracilimonas mengyeensis]
MLDALISSQLRVKLLLKFFINPELKSYLRGLSGEFDVSSNAVRQELNKLEEAGIIAAEKEGNKKLFSVNQQYPLYNEVRNLLMKTVGIEQVVEKVINRLGKPKKVYLTGSLARGKEGPTIDLYVIGEVNRDYLSSLNQKAEKLTGKKIRIAVFSPAEWDPKLLENEDHVLIFEGDGEIED